MREMEVTKLDPLPRVSQRNGSVDNENTQSKTLEEIRIQQLISQYLRGLRFDTSLE